MAKDITPYFNTKFQIKILMYLYKNIGIISIIFSIITAMLLTASWFVFDKEFSKLCGLVFSSITATAVFAVFVYIIIRAEKNVKKSSWFMFIGLISLSVCFIYNVIDAIKSDEKDFLFALISLLFIWAIIAMQKLVKYDDYLVY